MGSLVLGPIDQSLEFNRFLKLARNLRMKSAKQHLSEINTMGITTTTRRGIRGAAAAILALAGIAASGAYSAANATAIGFNGNYYDAILAPGITWTAANTAATSLTYSGAFGHLATITSLAEDAFLNTLRKTITTKELWVGGFQQPGSLEPFGGWTWVNGEGPISGTNAGPGYANWLGGEPNGVFEDFIAIGLGNNFGWNDEGFLGNIAGYIVEYQIPEPATLALFGFGLAGLAVMARRRKAA